MKKALKQVLKQGLWILFAVFLLTGIKTEAAAQKNIGDCLTYIPLEMVWNNEQIDITGCLVNTSDIYDIYELESVNLSIYDSEGTFMFNISLDDMYTKNIVLSPGGLREFTISVAGRLQAEQYSLDKGFLADMSASFTYDKCGGKNCRQCGGAPSVSQPTAADLNAEMEALMQNKPQMNLSCTYCGGDGYLDTSCNTCGGSGTVINPRITMFVATLPCPDCIGGYPQCGYCTFGIISNPNYEKEQKAWTEKRHDIWHQMGYSDQDIKRMEIEEAKAFLADYTPVESLCASCNGSKKCWRCGGSQYVYSGMGISACTKCTDGTCTVCGGTGLR